MVVVIYHIEKLREIKKVSRYPKPPPPTEEELEIQRKEEAEDKAARILARKEKRKNRKKKKGPFLLTDEAGNFQVSRVFFQNVFEHRTKTNENC